jgi:hypothetical protein
MKIKRTQEKQEDPGKSRGPRKIKRTQVNQDTVTFTRKYIL